MNTAAFRRIVWKEARAQFSLWLALVFGAFLLQITILETQGVHAQGLGFVATASFVLTACFAVASVAMLFAGEQEDGTRDWLRQLPLRPFVLAGAKLAFAAVAVALFFAATWGTGMLATTVIGRPAGDLFRADYSRVDVSFASILGVAGWGLLFSLLGRRVVFVLFAAVVTEILTVAIVDNVYPTRSSFLGNPQTADLGLLAVHLTIVAIVFAIDLVLALRWATAGAGPAARLSATHRRRGIAIPWQAAREHWWLRVVQWAALRGSTQARETAVLVWRELRVAVPFGVIWFVVGILATDLLSLASWNDRILRARPFQVLYLIVTPVVCGLLTCLGDQRQQMFRFLGERGVSPPRVWWIKQGVWLATAVLLSVACLRCDLSLAGIIERGWPQQSGLLMEVMRSVQIPGQEWMTGRRHADTPEDWALRRALFVSLLLALYAAGQWASFRIRRPILAFSSMLIVVPVLVGWHALLVGMDIPLWLCSWPLTLTLLAATLGSAGAWLRGRDTWTLRFTHLAAVALPAIAVITAAAAHRAYSVPEPVFTPEVETSISGRELAYDFYDRRLTRQLISVEELLDSRRASSDEQLETRRKQAELLFRDLAADLATGGRTVDPALYNRFHARRPSMGELLRDPDWPTFEAMLEFSRLISRESITFEPVMGRVEVLHVLRGWATRSAQSPEVLQSAFDYLVRDLQTPITARQTSINRYVYFSQLLEHRGRVWDALDESLERYTVEEQGQLRIAFLPWWERERLRRVLGHVTNEYLAGRTTPEDAGQQRGRQLLRWLDSTPAPIFNPSERYAEILDPAEDLRFIVSEALLHLRAQQAATALIIALQRYRLIHGSFPASLREVVPHEDNNVLADPYNNDPFVYKPEGLPADLYLPDGRVIAAGQPLLWSSGNGPGRPRQLLAPIHLESRQASFTIPTGAFVLSESDWYDWNRFSSPKLIPDQIRYVDSGTSSYYHVGPRSDGRLGSSQ